jgi:siderophore synthetase component
MKTLSIKGFAVRDFGGIRFHMPTLNRQGFFLNSIPAGSAITSSDLRDVRDKVHHSLIQNHLGLLIVSLQLTDKGGWAVVREELKKILSSEEGDEVKELYNYLFGEVMFFKCFLRMKMEGKYRDVSGAQNS